MNKVTLEYCRKKSLERYGDMYPPKEQDILEKLMEWSKDNQDKKIYKHFIRAIEENHTDENPYKPEKCSFTVRRCDLVYYLDIYYQ